jgi:hypothetical protein
VKDGRALTGMVDRFGNLNVELLLVSDAGTVQNVTTLMRPGTDGKPFSIGMSKSSSGPESQPQLLVAIASVRPLTALQLPGAVGADQGLHGALDQVLTRLCLRPGRAAEHGVTKKALSDYRDVLVQFRARSKRAADAGVPLAFRLDAIDRALEWLDHWSPPPSALNQRHAVALAYELATRWGMKTLVSRKGKWHQLAQILYGDREADLYRQVQTFAKMRRVRSRRTKVRSRRKPQVRSYRKP